MNFVQLGENSKAFDLENVVGVEITGDGKGEWVLRLYLRGCGEPMELVDEQLALSRLYKTILSRVGGCEALDMR